MKKLICVSLAVLGIAACGKGRSSNPITAAREASEHKDLQNTFQSECQNPNTFVTAITGAKSLTDAIRAEFRDTVRSERIQYVFTGDSVTRKMIWYKENGCVGDAVAFEERGSFNASTANKGAADGQDLDINFKALFVKVADSGVAFANAVTLCDVNTWKAGEEREIASATSANANCYGIPVPRDVYTKFRVDNKVLYLPSDPSKGNTKETREMVSGLLNQGKQFKQQ
ncbi:MAG: hypothetical protein KF799_14535 [Bdellovibrionales bacterium]|nr:hypothetical protein [Bdellovibrionales bacterium]